MDIKKQIEYWVSSANNDLETIDYLMQGKRYLYALFLCHLSVEKLIKAFVVINTKEIPPKLHNLNKLLLLANLEVDQEFHELLNVLMVYQLEGRYPEYYPDIPTTEKAEYYYNNTKKLVQWLMQKLSTY